jgi:hypothetical protein
MIDARDFYDFILDTVHDDIWKSVKDEFPSAFFPPFTTAVRETAQAGTAIVDTLRHLSSGSGIVSANMLCDFVKILGGGCRPTQAH